LKKKYNCYNPIDSESNFTAFEHRLPNGYTYPYPDHGDRNERDEATRRLDRRLFDDLKRKYRVIGDTAQMVKTVCAIFISFAGQVPKVCDCTEQRGDGGDDGPAGRLCLRNLYAQPDPASQPRNAKQQCVEVGYDRERHSHGVRHHGSSFAITERQRELISVLRRRDLVLYNVSRAVFAQQVAELEARHGIRVCDRWNRHGGTSRAPVLPEKRASHRPRNTANENTRGRTARRKPFLYIDELEHFLSHIPKTGAEYAAKELNHLLRAHFRLPDNRTLQHVSKAQRRFNTTAFVGDFFAKNANSDNKSFPHHLTGDASSNAYAPLVVCNAGNTALPWIQRYHVARFRMTLRYRCAMHVTEAPWSAAARNAYTIVREPLSHVLSQYFHCTESPRHKKQELMPTLDAWLETYTQLKQLNLTEERLQGRALLLKKKYNCYNPIDSESNFTAFEHRLLKGYTYPYPGHGDSNERDEATLRLDRKLFDDLERKFRVIGDTAQMVKTVCAIFISFTGQVPKVCDCTEQRGDGGNNHNGRLCLHDLYKQPDPASQPRNSNKCPLEIGYDRNKHSHGVQHHGSSFSVTERQRELISDLRRRDLVLYNVSRAVFAKQVADLEAQHGIRVCDRWNQHEGTWPAPSPPDDGRQRRKEVKRRRLPSLKEETQSRPLTEKRS